MDFQQRFMTLQHTLKTAIQTYQEYQQELPKLAKATQQFQQQQHENEMVLKELELVVDDDAAVYKLIGPALVKQDVAEAKANVQKRLEFIGDELKRIDSKIADVQGKIQKREQQIMQMQQEGQRMQQAAQAAAGQGS